MSLTKDLLEFRTTYLKAIAKAWTDPKFKSLLCEPNNALNVFKETYGYVCPWEINFSITDDGAGPFYNGLQGVYMVTPLSFDKFVLYVPKKPTRGNATEAAACFYNLSPWFLNYKDKTSLPKSPIMPPVLPYSAASTDAYDNSVLIPQTSYDLGDSEKDFTDFGGAIFAALALIWDNKKFKELFISDSNATEYPPIQQSVSLLKDWLNYDYPWDVDLVVREDPLADFVFIEKYKNDNETFTVAKDEENGKLIASNGVQEENMELVSASWEWAWIKDGKMFDATPLGLVLSLPERPDDAASDILALTRYNTDGPGFPFTC
jgi:ribosomally synthesized peptide (two-chain TOMM family)